MYINLLSSDITPDVVAQIDLGKWAAVVSRHSLERSVLGEERIFDVWLCIRAGHKSTIVYL